MNDFIFLKREQIFGENALSVFQEEGVRSSITDFAILLGGYVSDEFYVHDIENLENRCCWWWTGTKMDDSGTILIVDEDGGMEEAIPEERDCGIRLACKLGENTDRFMGVYPQTVVSDEMSLTLERLFEQNALKGTGKFYMVDIQGVKELWKPIEREALAEVLYEGEKYVRVQANLYDSREDILKTTLSTGKVVYDREYVWVKVEPIEWLIDQESGIRITKKAILSGFQYNTGNSYDGVFENADIKKYMDMYVNLLS